MSYENYKKAMEMAKELPDYMIYNCCSDKAMDELEDYLGFELSRQHYEFLRMGAFSVWAYDFVANYKNYHETSADITGYLELEKRDGLKVDKKFIPILEEDEWVNYLNYNRLTADGEPTVVYAFPTPGEFVVFEQTGQDLGDFLLELFEEIKSGIRQDGEKE